MNLHSKLIGALDGVILGLAALVTVALLFALFDPPSDTGASRSSVIERQHA